jgi:hypothetical protein
MPHVSFQSSSSGSILPADALSNRESPPCSHVGSSCFRGVLLLEANSDCGVESRNTPARARWTIVATLAG